MVDRAGFCQRVNNAAWLLSQSDDALLPESQRRRAMRTYPSNRTAAADAAGKQCRSAQNWKGQRLRRGVTWTSALLGVLWLMLAGLDRTEDMGSAWLGPAWHGRRQCRGPTALTAKMKKRGGDNHQTMSQMSSMAAKMLPDNLYTGSGRYSLRSMIKHGDVRGEFKIVDKYASCAERERGAYSLKITIPGMKKYLIHAHIGKDHVPCWGDNKKGPVHVKKTTHYSIELGGWMEKILRDQYDKVIPKDQLERWKPVPAKDSRNPVRVKRPNEERKKPRRQDLKKRGADEFL
eukprot:TRINITY_DN104675_c0_g1_i1.p1 TRINITY_DN104675_c0_g1~~TRINITY_DN104675_c0_g1_i1.p1  ORF type:complete len:290 (-),score=54.53 TRINITY_DN104675_c0_g1_i1:69-938(-)